MPLYGHNYRGLPPEIPPDFLRKLELLPAPLRERALRGWLEEHLSPRLPAKPVCAVRTPSRSGVEPAEPQARPAPDPVLQQGSPLRGYAQLKRAATPPPLEAFLDALLARMGHAPRGYDLEVARALLGLALEVGLSRGYHPATSEVVYHLPQGALALALWPEAKPETARKRVQRALARLSEAGLLAFTPRVGNARHRLTGESLGWMDGTVFRIRLSPGRARPITREELAYPWRDLEADTRQGRTLRGVSQSKDLLKMKDRMEFLKQWALPPVELTQTPLSDWDSDRTAPHMAARNAYQDVKYCNRADRPAFVEKAGVILARLLKDRASPRLYWSLLWGALRWLDRGVDRFEALWSTLDRVRVDLEEGFARRPGALLVARLRESGLWAELVEGVPYRVA